MRLCCSSGNLFATPNSTLSSAKKNRRGALWATVAVCGALGLGGCGVSVAAGGTNAATHPASGIWAPSTVGAGDVSAHTSPTLAFRPLPNTPPPVLPSGLGQTVAAVRSAVSGGCWEDSHQGNVYGAYDQLFWWQGDCGDTVVQVTMELYPSVGAASSDAHHASVDNLAARYRDGAVTVDVYANAPQDVLAELGSVKGLSQLGGYSG